MVVAAGPVGRPAGTKKAPGSESRSRGLNVCLERRERRQRDSPPTARDPVLSLVKYQDRHRLRSYERPNSPAAEDRDTGKDLEFRDQERDIPTTHIRPAPGPESPGARSNPNRKVMVKMRLPDGQPVG